MNNKTPKIITIIGVGILLFCNCYRIQFYEASTVHEPKFQQEGELHTALTLSDLHLAYSPVNNLGVMLSGYLLQGENIINNLYGSNNNDYTSLSSLDMGLGGYTDLGKNWNFSLYSGGGLGRTLTRISSSNSSVDSQLQFTFRTKKFFIQPGIYRTGKDFSLDVNLRLSGVYYSNMQVRNTDTIYYPGSSLRDLNNEHVFFFEPSITLIYNSSFNLFLQIASVRKLGNINIDYDISIFTFGISKNFNLKD